MFDVIAVTVCNRKTGVRWEEGKAKKKLAQLVGVYKPSEKKSLIAVNKESCVEPSSWKDISPYL